MKKYKQRKKTKIFNFEKDFIEPVEMRVSGRVLDSVSTSVFDAMRDVRAEAKREKEQNQKEKEQKIAVLVPCFNEEQTISDVIFEVRRELSDAFIYVYDNDSTDDTALIVNNLCQSDDRLFLEFEENRGKGNVVRRMFSDIEADVYVLIDGDSTYSLRGVQNMVFDVLDYNIDMIVGVRRAYSKENKRRFHTFGNNLVNRLVNSLFSSNLEDVMSGFRVFSRRFVKSYPVQYNGFELETDMTVFALHHGFNVEEVDVEYRDRPEGSYSKLDTYADGAKVLSVIMKLFRQVKPFMFFSCVSVILFLIGFGYFLPIYISFLDTGEVLKLPSLIVIVGVWLAALMSFFSGLILSVLQKYHLELFHQKLNL